METAAPLTNDWRVCRLLDLRHLPVRRRVNLPPGTDGPFWVLQRACLPESPEPEEFLLTRDGRWLSLTVAACLDEDDHDRLVIFTRAAEVMAVLAGLGPEASLAGGRERLEVAAAP
ncbi:MAG: hypothetical protein ACKVYV_04860 [Limisphaerales bacterium]